MNKTAIKNFAIWARNKLIIVDFCLECRKTLKKSCFSKARTAI